MKYGERLVRVYGETDWLARLILTTCFAAALNFGDCYSQAVRESLAAGTREFEGYTITTCYFGPPPEFFPRLIVLGVLLFATLFAFKRNTFHRAMCSVGLAGGIGFYGYWWISSYETFQTFQMAGIEFLNHVEIRQTAYLYHGSWLDLLIALALVVCLTLVLDRLIDGEKQSLKN